MNSKKVAQFAMETLEVLCHSTLSGSACAVVALVPSRWCAQLGLGGGASAGSGRWCSQLCLGGVCSAGSGRPGEGG